MAENNNNNEQPQKKNDQQQVADAGKTVASGVSKTAGAVKKTANTIKDIPNKIKKTAERITKIAKTAVKIAKALVKLTMAFIKFLFSPAGLVIVLIIALITVILAAIIYMTDQHAFDETKQSWYAMYGAQATMEQEEEQAANTPPGGSVLYQQDFEDDGGLGLSIPSSGCGLTSCAMIVSDLTGQAVSPVDIGKWAMPAGLYSPSSGAAFDLYPEVAKHYNLECEEVHDINQAVKALQTGNGNVKVISPQGSGWFTSGGHIIVLDSVTADGKINVKDPNKGNKEKNDAHGPFTPEEIDASGERWFIISKPGTSYQK